MTKVPKTEAILNPHWVTFWRRVRAAAEELHRIETEQTEATGR